MRMYVDRCHAFAANAHCPAAIRREVVRLIRATALGKSNRVFTLPFI